MSDVLVVSCERSGTHLMIDTLRDSFGMMYKSASSDIDYKKRNLALPDEMKSVIEKCLEDSKGNKILKSHHPFCFFEPIWDWITERLDVFYVSRDGRAVMASQWNHFRVMDVGNLGPVTFNVGDFMRATPGGTLATRYNGTPPPFCMLTRWVDHIASWNICGPPDVTYLRYEDDHKVTLKKMSEVTGRNPRTEKKPLVGGVTPWRGKKDTWREFFTEDDHKFFDHFARIAIDLMPENYIGIDALVAKYGIEQHEEVAQHIDVQA